MLRNHGGQNLNEWVDFPLTLIGRINAIKINILLQFLWMFQSLPIEIPAEFFSSSERRIR